MSIKEFFLSHKSGEVSNFSGNITFQHFINMRSIAFSHESHKQSMEAITNMTIKLKKIGLSVASKERWDAVIMLVRDLNEVLIDGNTLRELLSFEVSQ